MCKKLMTFFLVLLLVFGSSSIMAAASPKNNVPSVNNKEKKSVVKMLNDNNADEENLDEEEEEELEEETEEERPILGRQHSFKEKFIGPPAFVQEMKQERIRIRGKFLLSDVPSVIKEGRFLIPVRAVSNGLGADVEWDSQEQKVTITKGEIKIEIFLDSLVYYVNGEEMNFDVAAQLINNRTFVPLRFIAEALGEKVKYDDATGQVDIGDVDEETEEPDDENETDEDEEETEDEEENNEEESEGDSEGEDE